MGVETIGTFGKYPSVTLRVPADVRAQAKLGLELSKKHGTKAHLARTKMGRARAKQLMAGKITLRDLVIMRSYFARHAGDIRGVKLNRSKPSNGWLSWLYWGGTPAKKWVAQQAKKHARHIDEARSNESDECGCGEHDLEEVCSNEEDCACAECGAYAQETSAKVHEMPLDPHAAFDPYNGAEGLLVRVAILPVHPGSKRPNVEINDTKDVYELTKHLAWADREHMVVIALDNGNRVLAINEGAIGNVNNVSQSWHLLTRVPNMVGATRVILVHNHPGGTTGREGAAKPSKADKKMAKDAVRAFGAVGLEVLDVVVVAADSYSSALPKD